MATGAQTAPVVVIGGGAVGAMVGGFFRDAGTDVIVVDRAAAESSAGAYVQGDITAPGAALTQLLWEAGVVVLAVPEDVALAAVPNLGVLGTASVLVDTLSVKSRFAEALHGSDIACAAVGVNPMFAPSLDPHGRPVAAVTYRAGAGVDAVLATFAAAGATVVHLDADRHDRLTAFTQALTHASVLSFGLALAEAGLDPADLVAVGTPPYLLSLALLSRISGGTPEVYWDVQAGNPFAEQARRGLADAVARVNGVVTVGDDAGFARIMERAESTLGIEADGLRATCAEMFTRLGRKDGQ